MRRLILALLCLALVGAVYANSLNSPLHFDDFHSIQDNVWLRSFSYLPQWFTDVRVFSPLAENRAYRPILLLGFGLSYALGNGALWGYHLITMLLHALGAFVVGSLVDRLLKAKSPLYGWFAGAIFAVHPLLSEPVNYVSSRSSLQAAVFTFAAVLLYVKGREERRSPLLGWSVVLLLLGMGTKIIAMTVPALLLGWELWLGPDRELQGLSALRTFGKRLLPWLVVALGFTVFHEWLVGQASRAARSTIPPLSYFWTQTQVYLRFMGLFFWPQDLNADLTMRWSEAWWEGPVARAILVNLALVFAAFRVRAQRPLFWFGVFWFYVALSPTNSIMPLSEPASEHRVYIAFPGLLMAVMAFFPSLEQLSELSRRFVLPLLLGILVVAGGARTVLRNQVWASDLALWRDVVQQSSDNGRAHLNYGLALLEVGDRAAAKRELDQCAQVWPRYAFCWINLAAYALHENQQAEAERTISIAEGLAPQNVYTRLWRGFVERRAERWTGAESAFRRTLEIAPGHTQARLGLAFALFNLGRFDEARNLYAVLERDKSLDADGNYALGYWADLAGEGEKARAYYERAIGLDPSASKARYNLAVLLQKAGDRKSAIVHYQRLRAERHAGPDALFNLALALWQEGQIPEATSVRQELIAVAPAYPGLSGLAF
ncbi:MAG: tetratricopeptide repeat protein [Myxococcota bacterium]